jgi:hypothetical protein
MLVHLLIPMRQQRNGHSMRRESHPTDILLIFFR